KHDPSYSTGLAHYLEHLLFKGTKNIGTIDYEKEKVHLDKITELYEKYFHEKDNTKRKEIYAEINYESQLAAKYAIPNEFDQLYQSLGVFGLNAYTSDEQTVYLCGMPSNRLEQWAKTETERFKNPVFRLFQTELEIVYEEKNRSLDNKFSLIYEKVYDKLFKNHPYGQQTTIGTVEHLKNPSLKSVYEFFHTYYVPNNMAISLSGDFNSDEAIKIIEKYFGTWEKKELPKPKTWEEKPISEPEVVEADYLAEEYVVLAYRLPATNSPDELKLILIDMILDNSQAGLINLNLNQAQKVRQAGSRPDFLNDFGSQVLWGIPKNGQSVEEVRDLLLAQIELVKQGKFENWVLPAIITSYEKSIKKNLEKNDERAGFFTNAFVHFKNWKDEVSKVERMKKITKQEIVEAANKYFKNNYVTGFRRNKQHEIVKLEKPPLNEIQIPQNRQSTFVKNVLAMPVKEIQPAFIDFKKDFTKEQLRKGLDLFTVKNPVNDLFTISFVYDVGSETNQKLPVAASLLEKSGTEKLTSDAVQTEFFKLGSSFDVTVGENETVITLAGLDVNFEKSLELLQDVLHNFKPESETLEELVKIQIASREDSKKDDRTLQRALVSYTRYGKESPFVKTLTNKQLQGLTASELKGELNKLFTYEHKIHYVGTKTVSELKTIFQKTYKTPEKLVETPVYVPKNFVGYEKPVINFYDKESVQAKVRIEFTGEVFNLKESPRYEIYNEYFGGSMGSVVFQEMREARALAYSAWANFFEGTTSKDKNLMFADVGCQADKTPEAVKTFLEIIYNLPASDEKFSASKNALLNQYRTGKTNFREILTTVNFWEKREITGSDPRKEKFSKIEKIEFSDVTDFVNTKIKGQKAVISIVGDRNRVGMSELEKIAEIRFLTASDIFGY
ncbi:insulinase family protein, partial [bacterium]|nr:insulinase family protein [bacterium]